MQELNSPSPSTRLAFTIRELKTVEEFRTAEVVQRNIWAMPDRLEVVPLHLLLTAQKNGGLVLGAFDAAGTMVGFLFGFPGRTAGGRWKQCSHMAGVLPDYRRSGLGEALKRYQREFVLRQGLDLITWTFDPLEGVNATLNFAKLGAVCRTYERDLYGSMADRLNQGLPSDRFEVEWWIAGPRVASRMQQGPARLRLADMERAGAQRVNQTEVEGGLRYPLAPDLDGRASLLLVEIPADFQAIKALSREIAAAWREHTRTIFEAYFQAGHWATEFFSDHSEGERRNFYVLQRDARP
ncbi:MAG: hypothetical protein M5U01_21510 [Ardenticatenaceae bacterium]|nr:hypothetical protein [Ardenticatenaceae bacterium]